MLHKASGTTCRSQGCMVVAALCVIIVGVSPHVAQAEAMARPREDSTVTSDTRGEVGHAIFAAGVNDTGISAVANSVAGSICPFESQEACQTDTANFIYISDRLLNREQVDDFRPEGDLISRICWGGCLIGEAQVAGQDFECSGTAGGFWPPLAWQATFYEDDGGLPSAIPLHPTYDLVVDAQAPRGTTPCWDFTAPLEVNGVPEPLPVQPGECHWMKLSGRGEIQGDDRCLVVLLASADGNNLRLEDTNGVFQNEDQKTGDLRFCLDSGLVGATAPPASQDGGCGDRPVACCLPDGSCVTSGYTECIGVPGARKNAWAVVGNTCETATCPAIPVNDDCADAILTCNAEFADGADLPDGKKGQCRGNPFAEPPIPGEVCDPTVAGDCFDGFGCTPWPDEQKAYRCSIPSNNVLASKDIPGGSFPCGAMASNIWFEYTAPCSGSMTIRTCKNAGYDGMMAVWVFNDGCKDPDTGEDIVCPIENNENLLQCDDDSCPGFLTTEAISGEVAEGACVKVAVGGWSDEYNDAAAGRGLTVLDVGFLCDPPPPCVCVPLLCGLVDGVNHDIRKNRFLSFCPNSSTRSTRMRVSLLDNGCSVTGQLCIDDSECKTCNFGPNSGDACSIGSDCPDGSCVVSGETCEEQSPPVVLGWIGDPVVAGGDAPPDTIIAPVVGVDPGFRVWAEPLVHVADCEIAPGHAYLIELEIKDAPGLFAELYMRTAPKPQGKDWGDIVGHFNDVVWSAPNGLVNVDDVFAMIRFLALKPAPHITVVDLVGSGPTFVNMDANATDLLIILKAFSGDLFPPLVLLAGGYPDINGGDSLTDCPDN